LSYWNRPFFPDLCGDSRLDDPEEFDTIIRTGGSWNGISHAFIVIIEEYGWKHIVLISDDYTSSICWYSAKPLNDMLANDDNYTFAWLRFGSDPTDDELDDYLEQIRARARGGSLRVSYVNLTAYVCKQVTRTHQEMR